MIAYSVAFFYHDLEPYAQWDVLNFQNWKKVYALSLLMIIWSLLTVCIMLSVYVYTHIPSGIRRFLLVSLASLPCSRLTNFLFRLFDFTFVAHPNRQLGLAEELNSAAEHNMRVMSVHAARAAYTSQIAELDSSKVQSEYDGAFSACTPSF